MRTRQEAKLNSEMSFIDAEFDSQVAKDPGLAYIVARLSEVESNPATVYKAGLIAYSQTVEELARELDKAESPTQTELYKNARQQALELNSSFINVVLNTAEAHPQDASAMWMLATVSAYKVVMEQETGAQ